MDKDKSFFSVGVGFHVEEKIWTEGEDRKKQF